MLSAKFQSNYVDPNTATPTKSTPLEPIVKYRQPTNQGPFQDHPLFSNFSPSVSSISAGSPQFTCTPTLGPLQSIVNENVSFNLDLSLLSEMEPNPVTPPDNKTQNRCSKADLTLTADTPFFLLLSQKFDLDKTIHPHASLSGNKIQISQSLPKSFDAKAYVVDPSMNKLKTQHQPIKLLRPKTLRIV